MLITNLAADQNKTDLFYQKYLPAHKTDRYGDLNKSLQVDFKISKIKQMKDISQELNNTVKSIVDNQIKSTVVSEDLKQIDNFVHSQEFKKKIKKSEDYILHDKDLDWQKHLGKYKDLTSKIRNNININDQSSNYFKPGEKVFVIISSSLPDNIIKSYFESVEDIADEVTFVIRGTIGGVDKMKPTLEWIDRVTTKNDGTKYKATVIIEPRVVKKYNIKKVPAVLYIKNYDPTYLKSDDDETFKIHYGTVDFWYAIEKIKY